MTIPFVIDNQQHKMAGVLNDLLAGHKDTRSTSPPPTSTSVAGSSCVKGSDEGLEQLLGLVESLSQKIASIDQSGFLDASILGEIVHPQNFNTLRRIEEEDGKVVEEQEQFAELVSSEFLLQNLKNLLDAGMPRMLEDLPDGIHSGLAREGAKGVFFYFTAPGSGTGSQASGRSSRQHFWCYIDLLEDARGGRIDDNRYVITNLIQCQPDTPRIVPVDGEVDIFALQEKVIASIVQSSVEQVAVEEAPKQLDPIQQLNQPLPGVYIKELCRAHESFTTNGQVHELLAVVQGISQDTVELANMPGESKAPVRREDLKLVCFDYLWQ